MVAAVRAAPYGAQARRIGSVTAAHGGRVALRTRVRHAAGAGHARRRVAAAHLLGATTVATTQPGTIACCEAAGSRPNAPQGERGHRARTGHHAGDRRPRPRGGRGERREEGHRCVRRHDAAADFTEDSIVMYFEMLTQDDDLFRGAALHVEHRPVSAVCLECGHEFSADAPEPACARCGSQRAAGPRGSDDPAHGLGIDEEPRRDPLRADRRPGPPSSTPVAPSGRVRPPSKDLQGEYRCRAEAPTWRCPSSPAC